MRRKLAVHKTTEKAKEAWKAGVARRNDLGEYYKRHKSLTMAGYITGNKEVA